MRLPPFLRWVRVSSPVEITVGTGEAGETGVEEGESIQCQAAQTALAVKFRIDSEYCIKRMEPAAERLDGNVGMAE